MDEISRPAFVTSVLSALLSELPATVQLPISAMKEPSRKTAWEVDRFIGLPYDARHMDCADLAILIQRELFGREVLLAGKRPRPLRDDAQAQAIRAYTAQLADPVINPVDGDIVLMREIGAAQAGHIGTYFFLNFTPYVLHTTALLGASVLHRMQDLSGTGLTLEGFYRWK